MLLILPAIYSILIIQYNYDCTKQILPSLGYVAIWWDGVCNNNLYNQLLSSIHLQERKLLAFALLMELPQVLIVARVKLIVEVECVLLTIIKALFQSSFVENSFRCLPVKLTVACTLTLGVFAVVKTTVIHKKHWISFINAGAIN